MQDYGNAPEFSSTGNQVEQVGSNERRKPQAKPQLRPQESKNWFFSNHRDPATHFHVDNDCGRAQHDCPGQLVTEQGARLRSKDNLSQVNEASQRGHNPERDAEKLFHNEDCAR